MRIDFKRLKVPKSISWRSYVLKDFREMVANYVLECGMGIADHALALKIYNSDGEEDYSAKEVERIHHAIDRAPSLLIESVKHAVSEAGAQEAMQENVTDKDIKEG